MVHILRTYGNKTNSVENQKKEAHVSFLQHKELSLDQLCEGRNIIATKQDDALLERS